MIPICDEQEFNSECYDQNIYQATYHGPGIYIIDKWDKTIYKVSAAEIEEDIENCLHHIAQHSKQISDAQISMSQEIERLKRIMDMKKKMPK